MVDRRDVGKIEIITCPLCNSDRGYHRFFETVVQDEMVDEYRICRRCGLVFQASQMSLAEQREFYTSGYREMVQGSEEPIEKDIKIQRGRAVELVLFAKRFLDKVEQCLDIGSSTGILLGTVQEAFGCEGLGIEPGNHYRDFSLSKGIKAVGSLNEIDPLQKNRFDLVTMAHVLEHLSDPVEYLKELRVNWLAPSGHILVEVPNLFGHQSLEHAHTIAFSASSLKQTLRSAGYEVVRTRVHGQPRSLLIPLYLTILARVSESSPERDFGGSTGVIFRRKLGMVWHRLVTRIAPRWAWLPWPE
jgi:2-polyprenyl-3-methyl-5-hydroxy-6-metoxy-1,4-benzoquinol methylase